MRFFFSRSSTGEGHFYFTGVHMRRLFSGLKERIAKPPTSQPIPIPSSERSRPIAIPIARPAQNSTGLPPPLPPRVRSKTMPRKRTNQSPVIPIPPSSLRDQELVHTPSVSSFTQSPNTTLLMRLDHTASTTTINSSHFSQTEPSELDLASSTSTMNLSLSQNISTMLDSLSSEHTSSYRSTDSFFDDDQSDASSNEESEYIQMSKAQNLAIGASSVSGSASQNEFDFIENWRFECPMDENPAYQSMDTVKNT